MKNFIFILCGLMCGGGIANARLNLDVENPMAVLKQHYEGALPSQVSDWPKMSDFQTPAARMTCSAIGSDVLSGNPAGVLTHVMIGRFSYPIPGETDNGPLFPGHPEGKAWTLSGMFNVIPDAMSDDQFATFYPSVGMTMPIVHSTSTGDIQITILGAGDNATKLNDTTTFRKNGDELFWHDVFTDVNHPTSVDYYGYCYPIKTEK